MLGEDAPAAAVRYRERSGNQSVYRVRARVGSYSTAEDNSVRWLCLDFDGPGHAIALADPEGAARATMRVFEEEGLPVYLERSGGGMGWHLWLFFEEATPARLARQLAFALVPGDIPLAATGLANPAESRGIEVFPKQDRISRRAGLGNMVWLPWWSDAAPGGNLFYRGGDSGSLEAWDPGEFTRVSTAAVEAVLARNPTREPPGPEAKDAACRSPGRLGMVRVAAPGPRRSSPRIDLRLLAHRCLLWRGLARMPRPVFPVGRPQPVGRRGRRNGPG